MRKYSSLNVISFILMLASFHANAANKDPSVFQAATAAEKLGDTKKALGLYRKAAQIPEVKAEATIRLGHITYHSQNDLEGAVAILNEFLEENPFHIGVRTTLAEIYLKAGQNDLAFAEINKVDSIRAEDPMAGEVRGKILLAAKKYAELTELTNQLLKKHPELSNVKALRAKGYIASNQYDKALVDLRELFAEGLVDIELQRDMGEAELHVGKLADSEQTWGKILKNNPEDVQAHEKLGDIAVKQNRPADAITFYSKAIQLNSSKVDVGKKLAALYVSQGNYKLAIEEYKRQRTLNPTDKVATHELVKSLYKMNSRDKVPEILNSYNQSVPEDLWAAVELATMYSKIAKHERAIEIMKTSMKSLDESPESLIYAAFFYSKAKEWDKAIDLLKDAMEKNPKDERVYYNLALVYFESGKADLAQALIQKLSPQSPLQDKALQAKNFFMAAKRDPSSEKGDEK